MCYPEILPILLDNIEAIYADKLIQIDRYFYDIMVKYRPIILLMHAFLTEMRSTNSKETEFNSTELKRLLEETNFLAAETIWGQVLQGAYGIS